MVVLDSIKKIEWLDLRHCIENKPKPIDFVLPGLKAGTVGAIVSPGGVGKSFFALQAAITVAGGADLLGLASLTKSWSGAVGRVVILTAEDPPDILSGRIHSIAMRLPASDREAIYENLSIAPLVGLGVDIMSTEWQEWIRETTRDARLVIIDTLRRFHILEENDGGKMAMLLSVIESICRENQTTFLFLHHTNKNAVNNGDAQQASRGSSVLTDNVRFQANIVSMTEAQADEFGTDQELRKYFVRITFPKTNFSAPIDDKWFRKNASDGVLEPVELFRPSKNSIPKPTPTPSINNYNGGNW